MPPDTPTSPSTGNAKVSLIVAAVLSAFFIVDYLLQLLNDLPAGEIFAAMWAIAAVIGSPIGTYRGCLALRLPWFATLPLTVVSVLPPIGLLIHLVLLLCLRSPKAATEAR